MSYLYGVAEAISAQNKPAYLYYLGDHDPSGVDIPRNVEARLREFAPQFEGVTHDGHRAAKLNLLPTYQGNHRALLTSRMAR